MRYKQYYAIIWMAVALLLPSCSQDEDTALPQGADGGTQTLTITTRTDSGQDGETTSTPEIDSFHLYLYDYATGTKKDEHLLTWDDTTSAWLENGEQPVTALLPAIVNASVCDDPDQITFENKVESGEIALVTCKIPNDQTDVEVSAAAGKLMFAISELDRGETLSLTFQRACAKLVFLVDNTAVTDAGGGGKLTNINVGAYPEYVYHYYKDNDASNYYTWNEDDKCDVACSLAEADAEHDNKPSITAYIGYRRCNANDVLLTLDVDGISRNVRLNKTFDIIPGNEYTFNLNITPKEVTASVVSSGGNALSGWDEDSEQEL